VTPDDHIYLKQLNIPTFTLTPQQLARVVQVVEKYSREHLAGHLTEQICLYNAGSEREVLMEDELWDKEDPDDLLASTASLLWHFGFSLNHKEG